MTLPKIDGQIRLVIHPEQQPQNVEESRMNPSVNTTEADSVSNTTRSQTYDADAVISKEVYAAFRLIFVGFLALAVSFVGVATNMVNCLVFCRQGLGDRMNLCLFCLALVDLSLLTFGIPFCLVTILCDLFVISEEHFFKTSLYLLGIVYAFRATSGCYNMVIAVERCVCVILPLHATSLMCTRTMGAVLIAISVILQIGYLTAPFRHQVVRIQTEGKVLWYLGLSAAWANNKQLFDLVYLHLLSVSLPLVTFTVVSIAMLVTVIKLKVAIAWREKSSSNSSENRCHQTALTKTLVLASCVYIITMTPFVCSKLVSIFWPDFFVVGHYLMLYNLITYIANVCPTINSSLHFFFYYSRSSRFRHELRALCCHSKPR